MRLCGRLSQLFWGRVVHICKIIAHFLGSSANHKPMSVLATLFRLRCHYVTLSAMASQITSLTIVYLSVYSGAGQRKHQSSASLAFVRGIHRWLVHSPHKWPVKRKMAPFDDVMIVLFLSCVLSCMGYVWYSLGEMSHHITMTGNNPLPPPPPPSSPPRLEHNSWMTSGWKSYVRNFQTDFSVFRHLLSNCSYMNAIGGFTDDQSTLVQVMAWCNKPLPEPMLT